MSARTEPQLTQFALKRETDARRGLGLPFVSQPHVASAESWKASETTSDGAVSVYPFAVSDFVRLCDSILGSDGDHTGMQTAQKSAKCVDLTSVGGRLTFPRVIET